MSALAEALVAAQRRALSAMEKSYRRYRRKVASPKQWQAIIAAKRGPCRVCGLGDTEAGDIRGAIQYHHVVERDAPHFGDDVADNIVPLHAVCHDCVTSRLPSALANLRAHITDAERAYVVGKLGESGPARLFGVGR